MNRYNLYPYYKLALAKTSLLGKLSAKISKTLLKAVGANQSLGKLCTHLLIDGFLSLINIEHRQIADNFPKAIQQLQKG